MRRLNDVPIPDAGVLTSSTIDLNVHFEDGRWEEFTDYVRVLRNELGDGNVETQYAHNYAYPMVTAKSGDFEITVFGPDFTPNDPGVPVEEAVKRERERATAGTLSEAPEAGDVDAEPGA